MFLKPKEVTQDSAFLNSIIDFLQEEWSNDRLYITFVEKLWDNELFNLITRFHKKNHFFDAICCLIYQSFIAHIQFVNISSITAKIADNFRKNKMGVKQLIESSRL